MVQSKASFLKGYYQRYFFWNLISQGLNSYLNKKGLNLFCRYIQFCYFLKKYIINLLFNSGKVKDSEEWDAIYQDDLPIAVAESTAELEEALNKLDIPVDNLFDVIGDNDTVTDEWKSLLKFD